MLYNIVLVSAIHQRESATVIHTPSPSFALTFKKKIEIEAELNALHGAGPASGCNFSPSSQVIIILKQACTVYICALAPSLQSKFLSSSLPCKCVSN